MYLRTRPKRPTRRPACREVSTACIGRRTEISPMPSESERTRSHATPVFVYLDPHSCLTLKLTHAGPRTQDDRRLPGELNAQTGVGSRDVLKPKSCLL